MKCKGLDLVFDDGRRMYKVTLVLNHRQEEKNSVLFVDQWREIDDIGNGRWQPLEKEAVDPSAEDLKRMAADVISSAAVSIRSKGECRVQFCRKQCPPLPADVPVSRGSWNTYCEKCGCLYYNHPSYYYPSGIGHVHRICDGRFVHL